MGGFSDKERYFVAYKSIKFILEKSSHMTGTIDDVFLIAIRSIPKYLEILNKRNVLKYIPDITKRAEVYKLEDKLLDDFGDYELEKNIEFIYINEGNYRIYRDREFILVDRDLIINMNIENNNNIKYKIIVTKEEIKLELYDEQYILIEETEKKGIYRFGETRERSIDFSGDSIIGEEDFEDEEENFDPEVDMLREKPKHIEDEKIEENKEENSINIFNEIEINDKKSERASIAKLDEIIQLIFFSIQNFNDHSEIVILESIQKKIQGLKINNILEEHDNLDIIKNIKNLVMCLLENFNKNLDNNYNSDYHNDESQNLLLSQDNQESYIPLIDRDDENMEFNNQRKILDPFNFILVEISRCENCNNFRNIDINSGFYQLNLSETCNNLDKCFKSNFGKKCDKCKDNAKIFYKFKTTPEILIIVFDKPKVNKNYISLNSIEENIDLKNYLLNKNSLDKNKYTLIKSLYVFDDINDENLYVNIPRNKKNNYIPYIIFYKKIGDL